MIRGPSFIVSTMQEETTPIFKRLWYDWTQQQPGIEPTKPLGQCWVPPIVAFYDQQGLLRTYSLPGSSIRSPHPGSPRGTTTTNKQTNKSYGLLGHLPCRGLPNALFCCCCQDPNPDIGNLNMVYRCLNNVGHHDPHITSTKTVL